MVSSLCRGWFFRITADNLTIKGSGVDKTVIYGDTPVINGDWATMDLVLVEGNNVSFEGITFMPNEREPNKTIEVMAKNTSITNCSFKPNKFDTDYFKNATYGGSLYFNGGALNNLVDLGTVFIKNNYFSYSSVCFDSAGKADSIMINDNEFENIGVDYYAIGNTCWSNPPVVNMATLYINDNKFTANVGEILLKNRLNGEFVLNGTNNINNVFVKDISKENLSKYLLIKPRSGLEDVVNHAKIIINDIEF